ncbi:helix-turn-helix transcriptional regulator [Lentzea sp. NPDC051208]|uniref:helix-turn-helix domain-containing protein n=1 Tax=Lentzea sp. NPDC051208 TaxID=3154642 RepID=UPI003442D174
MSQRDTPVVHQRRLRAELRRLREDKLFTQKYVAEQLEWSVSKIIRVENGSSNIGSTDLKALLELYDVTDSDRVNELLAEARASRQSVWWTRHRPYIDPQFYFFIGIEASVERIRQYQALAMPGLLQTRSYTQALALAVETDETEIQRGVDIRMKRQGIVVADGPELHFIIDEAVLRRYVDQVDVMIEQWEAILEKAELPNVTVQVLRLGPHVKTAHRGLRGSFSLLKLPDDDAEVLVLEEPLRDVMIRDDQQDIEKYDEAFDILRGLALDKKESIAFIRNLIVQARDAELTAEAV